MNQRVIGVIALVCIFFTSYALGVGETKQACPDFPFFRPISGPLALINCDFHHEYELKVKKLIQTFGAPKGIPIILNLGGTLVLKYNGVSKTIDITPDIYQEVKVFAHTFFALALALSQEDSAPLSTHTQDYLRSLQLHLQQGIQLIPSLELSLKERETVIQLANLTNNFLQELLRKKGYNKEQFQAYIHQARPLVFQITVMASNFEIHALDAAINPWLAAMSPEDKEKIAIVVAASHQAVEGELSIQYFIKKFGPRYRVGSVPENGLVVVQDAFDEASALKLLARHYLDKELSVLLFNDSTYLQRDVLSEAGRILL